MLHGPCGATSPACCRTCLRTAGSWSACNRDGQHSGRGEGRHGQWQQQHTRRRRRRSSSSSSSSRSPYFPLCVHRFWHYGILLEDAYVSPYPPLPLHELSSVCTPCCLLLPCPCDTLCVPFPSHTPDGGWKRPRDQVSADVQRGEGAQIGEQACGDGALGAAGRGQQLASRQGQGQGTLVQHLSLALQLRWCRGRGGTASSSCGGCACL